MKEVAKEAAEETLEQWSIKMGIDPKDPIEVQRDMAALREFRKLMTNEQMQADIAHLRQWRLIMESVKGKGVIVGAGMLFTGAIAFMLWGLGVKLPFSS
jgi:hypothetical protein